MQEIMEKYYSLHKKNLIGGRNESIDSAAINYEIDTGKQAFVIEPNTFLFCV